MSKTNTAKRKSIEDIPAQEIKSLLILHGFEYPTDSAIEVAAAAFTFIKNFDGQQSLFDTQAINAFNTMERMFNFYVDLLNLSVKTSN